MLVLCTSITLCTARTLKKTKGEEVLSFGVAFFFSFVVVLTAKHDNFKCVAAIVIKMNKPRFVRSSVIGKFQEKKVHSMYKIDYQTVVGGRGALQT